MLIQKLFLEINHTHHARRGNEKMKTFVFYPGVCFTEKLFSDSFRFSKKKKEEGFDVHILLIYFAVQHTFTRIKCY